MSKKEPMTKEEFEALNPFDRGFAAYMLGAREDEPNVPDEENPYSPDSIEFERWDAGQEQAVLAAQDSEE